MEAWVFPCEIPYQFKLSRNDAVDYAVNCGNAADYEAVKMVDKNLPTIEPKHLIQLDVAKWKSRLDGRGLVLNRFRWIR
jgi:hypothetical protein